jgi:hypothetical protein
VKEKPKNRVAVRVLVGLGTLFTVLAIFSIWAERQALDTQEWGNTSSKLLDDKDVQDALSVYLADQLFNNVDVQAKIAEQLSPRAQPLAGPITGALHQAATAAAERALAVSKVQEAWKAANLAAHGELLDVINDKGQFTSTGGGDVTLELEPLVAEIADDLGIGADVADKIPPDAGSLVILHSDSIETAQKIAKLIKGLAVVFTILALAGFALAIYLAPGRRPGTIIWCGLGLIFAGIVVFAIRHIAGQEVVDALVVNDSATDAGNAVWSIGTSLLTSIATTVIVYGVLFVIAGWLASATSSARWARKQLAPVLRDRAALVYGLLVAAALIYFAFAPTHGLRAVLTIVILTGLAAAGVNALRKQTDAEFPA